MKGNASDVARHLRKQRSYNAQRITESAAKRARDAGKMQKRQEKIARREERRQSAVPVVEEPAEEREIPKVFAQAQGVFGYPREKEAG